jgi:hypothetical protein
MNVLSTGTFLLSLMNPMSERIFLRDRLVKLLATPTPEAKMLPKGAPIMPPVLLNAAGVTVV